jgi:hypothetical protein
VNFGQALVVCTVALIACGDNSGGSDESEGASTTSSSTATLTDDSSTTATMTSATGDTGDGSTDTSDTGASGEYIAWFRLQAFAGQIQLLGNFLETYTPAGGTTVGECTKQGVSTGVVAPGGSMTVLRGEEVLLVVDPTPSADIATVALENGDELTFDGIAPDDIAPPFSVGPIVVPSSPVDVVGPDTIIIGEPVTISWTPPAEPSGELLVELVQSLAGVDKVECLIPVADGSVTIEAALLTHLVPTDDENPMVQMAVSPFDEVITQVDGGTVEIEFLHSLATFGAPAVAG